MHLFHSHQEENSEKGGSNSILFKGAPMAKDPVCGMDVATNKAVKSYHQGTAYYFCSESCKKTFESNKDAYVPATDRGGHMGHGCCG